MFVEDPGCFGIEVDGLDTDQVRCGTVTAPLQHDDLQGPTIELAVVRLGGEHPGHDPVLVLGGGPGEAMIEPVLTTPELRQHHALEGREVIVVDQRGVGASSPQLRCDALDTIPFLPAGDAGQRFDAVQDCRDELAARGVELDAFDHVNNARDVDLVRRALGHDRVALRGTSYGTHLALHVAALAPDGVSALVLSSPADPTVPLSARGFQAALDRVDEACHRDERCRLRLGGVHETIDLVTDRLASTPEEVTATAVGGGASQTRTYTPEVFVSAVFTVFYAPFGGLLLPELLAAARDGDLEPLARFATTFEAGLEDVPVGMYLSMICSEPRFDIDAARAELRSPALATYWFDPPGAGLVGGREAAAMCEVWDVSSDFHPDQLDLATTIPTLLITGEPDHVTPPEVGRRLDRNLTNSYLVEVPGLAHAPLESLDTAVEGCGRSIVTGFLDNPDHTPDTTCTRQAPPLHPIGRFLP